MTDNATMADGEGWGLARHRFVSIKKVENGFLIEATFPVPRKDQYTPSQETRKFVFQNLSETIAWVNKYLSADASELQQ